MKLQAARVMGFFGVFLALTIALNMIEGVGGQRQVQRALATESIAAGVAGAPTLVGPWMSRQCEETFIETTKTTQKENDKEKAIEVRTVQTRSYTLSALPESNQISGTVNVEPRYRGIYKANVLGATLSLQTRWASLQELVPPALKAPVTKVECAPVKLQFYVSDQRSLRNALLVFDGTDIETSSGTQHSQLPLGLSATIADAAVSATTTHETKLSLNLAGTETLAILPLGKTNAVALQSNWPHPSFGGAFLPTEHSVTKAGFTAMWTISALSSSARSWFSNGSAKELNAREAAAQALRVQFIDPVNPAVLADRATKYSFLFVLLSFVGVGLLQVLRKLDIHPMQYLMTGAALAIFFLLLISLSEHIAFQLAYVAAAAACAVLLGAYAASMLRSKALGAGFAAAIGALYASLYLVLQSEQHALLAGSLTVFAVLACVMMLTRRMDWSQVFARMLPRPAAAIEPPATDAPQA
jgi:inner membrane protein